MSDWLERNRNGIFFTLINLVSVGLVVFWLRRPQPLPMRIETATPAPMPTVAKLRVYVCGAVASPDVYLLDPGAIIKDAIGMAGGVTAEADLTRVNLALSLQDGDQVYVPVKGEENAPTPESLVRTAGKVNINKASLAELQTLPGIGEIYAQRIIEYRTMHGPFQSVEDLLQVRGIGNATLDRLRDLITVR